MCDALARVAIGKRLVGSDNNLSCALKDYLGVRPRKELVCSSGQYVPESKRVDSFRKWQLV